MEVITAYEKYYSPEEQINHTEDYNEMDYKRFQKGERKQPDYIVFFQNSRKQGMTYKEKELFKKSQKASKDFGGLPIVVIDIEKCSESEKKKVDELYKKFERTEKTEILYEIFQKVRNNRVTTTNKVDPMSGTLPEFCPNVDLKLIKSRLEELNKKQKENVIESDIAENLVGISELEGNYEMITTSERKDGVQTIKLLYEKVKQLKNQKENIVQDDIEIDD